jgi:hypothetical protein
MRYKNHYKQIINFPTTWIFILNNNSGPANIVPSLQISIDKTVSVDQNVTSTMPFSAALFMPPYNVCIYYVCIVHITPFIKASITCLPLTLLRA